MILNTEQLGHKARELALRHDLRVSRRPSKEMWRQFEADMESLRAYARSLQDCRASCSQPAEDWLLDHADFLEEQALVVQHQLTVDFLNNLPLLRKSFELRVQSICADYLEHSDGVLDLNSFISYLTAYQEVSVLSMAEAWAIPPILRVALIRRLAVVMELVRERREVCVQVERLLSRIEPSKLNQETLKAVLDEAGEDIPLSGALIVHLVSHLREWAYDSAGVHEWLLCKLENGPESLDRIVTYEHQLQASDQVTAGSLIGSLRQLAHLDWRNPFEQICLVERTLRQESAGDYPRLDFASRDVLRRRVEKLAHRMNVPENLVAQQAVELAAQQYQRVEPDGSTPAAADAELPRRVNAAYYLLDQTGIRELRRALTSCSRPRRMLGPIVLGRATGVYFSLLAGLFAIALLAFAAWVAGGVRYTMAEWLAIVAALLFPASEWAITLLHGLIQRTLPASPLLRLDFSRGVPVEASTMVVIPVIWSTPDEVRQMVERLELHYLANRDPNIHFALLGDFADAQVQSLPEDDQVLSAAKEGIQALNSAYYEQDGSTFHLFHRHRLWNPSEEVWMGWERKRGKLVEFVELLKGRTDTSFDLTVGDSSVLPSIRYIITLDSDTQIPMGDAQRMIGTQHLSYNRPRLNRSGTRVVEGYGVLQPRIGISHEAASRSRLASLWAGEPGIDPYAFAVSDPYQDAFGEAIFTGKGIFNVNAFAQVLCNRIPDNRVLSHDLLEGGFLRAGLFADIELIDDHPATFSAFQRRMHRWVRGDWQLFCWLFPRVCDRRGTLLPVDLSVVTRWQIIDNLRRSLLLPVLYVLLALGLTVLPGAPVRWLWLVLATLCLPVIRQLSSIRKATSRPRAFLAAVGQALVTLVTLPFQSALLLNAIGKSLYRLFVSRRHLLEWVSSAEQERRNRGGRKHIMQSLWGGYLLVILMAVLAATRSTPTLYWTGLAISALWALAPLGIRWLDRSRPEPAEPLSAGEKEELRDL
ncbi:MAG: chbP, partial [Bacilli bacterium]|nr:chbP [Bacilli bacterium]